MVKGQGPRTLQSMTVVPERQAQGAWRSHRFLVQNRRKTELSWSVDFQNAPKESLIIFMYISNNQINEKTADISFFPLHQAKNEQAFSLKTYRNPRSLTKNRANFPFALKTYPLKSAHFRTKKKFLVIFEQPYKSAFFVPKKFSGHIRAAYRIPHYLRRFPPKSRL